MNTIANKLGTKLTKNHLSPMCQGMLFKFRKEGDKFIHTYCDGDLLSKIGLHKSDMIGKDLFDFLPREFATYKKTILRKAWEGNEFINEYEINDIKYLVYYRPTFINSKVIEVTAYALDTTRWDTEDEIIYIKTPAEKMLYVSQSMSAIGGYNNNESSLITSLAIVHPDDVQSLFEVRKRVYEDCMAQCVKYRAKTKAGEWLLLLSSSIPIVVENKCVLSVVITKIIDRLGIDGHF
jgi:hypothetical protein